MKSKQIRRVFDGDVVRGEGPTSQFRDVHALPALEESAIPDSVAAPDVGDLAGLVDLIDQLLIRRANGRQLQRNASRSERSASSPRSFEGGSHARKNGSRRRRRDAD